MSFPADPTERSPKGDHNRRIALGFDINQFAVEAGVSTDDLHAYETTGPDQEFDVEVAHNVGIALERLEASVRPVVEEGPPPSAH